MTTTHRNSPRYFSIPEAAEALGMSPQTLWRRVRQQRVVLPRVGGRLVVPASRLNQLGLDETITARRYARRTK
jgi:hypothetical protein